MKVLAVGVARSGTSFLGELFRRNPGTPYLFEPFWGDTFFVRKQWTWLTEADDEPEAETILREVFEGRFEALERQQAAPKNRRRGFASRGEELRASLGSRWPGRADDFALKEIRLNLHLRWAARVLGPALRIVHLVRDPRGVVASFLFAEQKRRPSVRTLLTSPVQTVRRAFTSAQTLLDEWSDWLRIPDRRLAPPFASLGALFDTGEPHQRVAARWAAATVHALEDSERLGPGQYFRVRYEDLCLDPVGQARRVYRFLDRPLPGAVEDWLLENTRGGDRQNRYGTSRNSLEMPHVWKTQLTRQQISDVEAVAASVMARLGYEPY